VGELHSHRLAGVDQRIGMRTDDLARLPGLATIVAVNDRDRGGAMLTRRRGEPDGNDQPTAAQSNSVSGSGCEHVPVVCLAEPLKCAGDVARLTEGDAVVL